MKKLLERRINTLLVAGDGDLPAAQLPRVPGAGPGQHSPHHGPGRPPEADHGHAAQDRRVDGGRMPGLGRHLHELGGVNKAFVTGKGCMRFECFYFLSGLKTKKQSYEKM